MPKTKSETVLHRFFSMEHQIIYGDIGSPKTDDRCDLGAYKVKRDFWRTVPKFYLSHAACETFSQSHYDMVIDMARKGVINLPLQNMIIELELPESRLQWFYTFEQIEDRPKCFKVFTTNLHRDTGVASTLPIALVVDLTNGDNHLLSEFSKVPWIKEHLTESEIRHEMNCYNAVGNKPWDCIKPDFNKGNVIIAGVRFALTAFLALYVTRGIEKREVVYSDRDNLKRARMNLGPRVSHTILKLDDRISYLAGKTYTKADGKARMRLHWRCGHNKQQAYGPNSSLRKEIWVDPYLVGCDDNGVITHDYSIKGKKPNDPISANAPVVPTPKAV